MLPWGVETDAFYCEVFDLWTSGYSPRQISARTGRPEREIVKLIKSTKFKADLKLLQDDIDYETLSDPLGRIERLQHMAIDVLVDEMTRSNGSKRIEAATDILDRGRKVPRRSVVENPAPQIPGQELAFLAVVLREISNMNRNSLDERQEIREIPARSSVLGASEP
jgi:hypothetical protein